MLDDLVVLSRESVRDNVRKDDAKEGCDVIVKPNLEVV